MSKGVKVSPKLDWKTSKGFQVWYICSICNRAYKEASKLKEHKHQVHFPSLKKRKAYRKSLEKSDTETLSDTSQEESQNLDSHSASESMEIEEENNQDEKEMQSMPSEHPVPDQNKPGILATE